MAQRALKNPNACLAEIREFITDWDRCDGDGMDAGDFINLVEGLDQWLSKKGTLPKAWKR